MGFDDKDLRRLELELLRDPSAYPVIKGTGGLRKIRFSFEKENLPMGSVYESIMTGLNEAVEDAVSKEKKLVRRKLDIVPVKEYQADEVREIRKSTGMSQKTFANFLGVSDKTVEAWEAGMNHPSGAASRLLSMIEMDNDLVKEFPFVRVIEK